MGVKFSVADIAGTLLLAGFFPVLGTTEHRNGVPQIVKRGIPLTWDFNQGVTAIYDFVGLPWIQDGFHPPEAANVLGDFGTDFRRGAPVPHSNDGGRFIRMIASL